MKWSAPLLLVFFAFLACFLGAKPLTFLEILSPESLSSRIFWDMRLPRTIFVLFCGGALAIIGMSYQTMFRNALAEPYVLGISSAVALGAVLGEAFFHLPSDSLQNVLIGGVVAAAVSTLLVLLSLARFGGRTDKMVLFGMGLNFVLSSALFLFLSYSNRQLGAGSMRWLFGQIPWVSAKEAGTFSAVTLIVVGIVFVMGRQLDAMSLGDSVAKTLGVSAVRSRNMLVILTSALLSVMVVLTGSIGFVGLVVPHATRLLFRPSNHRQMTFLAFCVGGAFLAASDVLSRVLFPPFEFPIGIITTLFGGPLFLALLWRR